MKSLITFINCTESPAAKIVFFNRNLLAAKNQSAVAWKTIYNCQPLHVHPFFFSNFFEVGVSDACGNFSPRLSALSGGVFALNKTTVHRHMVFVSPAKNSRQFEIKNNLQLGSVNAHVFLENRIYATQKSIAPGQRALFEFDCGLSVAVLDQHDGIDTSFIDNHIQLHTEERLLLNGISKANVIMKEAEYGNKDYEFFLENING